jgi:hypothetical protein
MRHLQRNLLVLALGIAVLALPAGALAGHGQGHGKGHAKTHEVAYVFKGTYTGESSVTVKHGNAPVRKGGFVGQTVKFDFSNTRFTVADTNGDGMRNLNDVAVGDKVVVIARLPRKNPGEQPFVAKRLIDQTHGEGSESPPLTVVVSG